MMSPALLGFVGGVLVGLLAAVLWRKIFDPMAFPDPAINVTCLSGGMIRIDGSVGTLPANVELINLHAQVYDDTSHPVPDHPGSEGASAFSSFPIELPLPGGSTPPDLVAVWAEFRIFGKDTATCSCSGSSSTLSKSRRISAVSSGAAEQLEAMPRTYRVSHGLSNAGSSGGPALQLIGSLNPESLLRYVPEASTPAEPLWRARGGADSAIEWTLRLLHGSGGFGAVLSVRGLIGSREVRFNWVTSDWRFHVANRLISESDEPGAPALIVSPA